MVSERNIGVISIGVGVSGCAVFVTGCDGIVECGVNLSGAFAEVVRGGAVLGVGGERLCCFGVARGCGWWAVRWLLRRVGICGALALGLFARG